MSTIRRVHSSGSLGDHTLSSAPTLPKKAPSRSRSNPFRRPTHKRSVSAQVPGEARHSSRQPPAPRHVPTGSLPVMLPSSAPRNVPKRNISLGAGSEPASPARLTGIGRDASQRPNVPTPPELPEETAAGLELADSPPPFGLLPAFSLSPQGEFAESVHRPINELQQSRMIRMRTRANSGAVDPPRTIPARLFVQSQPPLPTVPPPSPPRAQRIVSALRRQPSIRNEPIRKGETLLAGALQDSRSLCTAADTCVGVSSDRSQAMRTADERPGHAEAKSVDAVKRAEARPKGCTEPQETVTRTDERFSAVMREWQSAFGAFVPENTTQVNEGTAGAAEEALVSELQPHSAPGTAPEQPMERSTSTSTGPPAGAEPPATAALTEASSTAETPVSALMYNRSGHGGRDVAAGSSMPPLTTPPPPFTPFTMTSQRAQIPAELHSSPTFPAPHAPPSWLSPALEGEAETVAHAAAPRDPRRKKSKMGLFLKETLFPRQARSNVPMTARAADAERHASPELHECRGPSLERRASTLSLCSTLSGSPRRISTRMSDSPTLGRLQTHSVVDALNPRSFSTSDYVSSVPVPAPTSPVPADPAPSSHEAPQVPISAGVEQGNTQPPRRSVRGLGRRIASSLSLSTLARTDAAYRPETVPRHATGPRQAEEGPVANSAMPTPPMPTSPTNMSQGMNHCHAATSLPSPRSDQPRGTSRAPEIPVRPPGSRSESEQAAGSSPRARRWAIPFSIPARLRGSDLPRMRARAASDTAGFRRNSRMP